jgi:ZIP family zinc transporter
MIVGAGYTALPAFGIMLAIVITIHNIPEGIAVSAPLCASGCSKRKVFTISLLSGLAEPVGAVLALLTLSVIPGILPLLLGFAGGVMTYITMDELIPTARKYGHSHVISTGLVIGLVVALLIGHLV